MKKRLLVLLDLIELTERSGMDELVFEFLEVIVTEETKAGKLPKNTLAVVRKFKKRK